MTTIDLLSENEISLSAIIKKIWRKRGLVVLIPTLTTLLGVAVMAVYLLSTSNPIIQYVSLTGVQKRAYPNGSTFSPQDMINPEVIARLGKQYSVKNLSKLRSAITVSFSSPTTKGILDNYNAKLERRNLTTVEIDQINSRLSEELRHSSESTIKISVNYWEVGLNSTQAKELVWLLPKHWAEVYTTRFRILESAEIARQPVSEIQEIITPEGVIKADKNINQVKVSLNHLIKDKRYRAVQSKSGLAPTDLLQRLGVLSDVYLSAIINKNLATEDPLIHHYVNGIKLKIESVDDELEGLRVIISDIKTLLKGQGQVPRSQSGNNPQVGLDLSGDALQSIVELANRASLSNYLTELFDTFRAQTREKSELTKRLKQINQTQNFSKTFVKRAETQMNELVKDYNEILTQVRIVNRNDVGNLYRLLGSAIELGGFSSFKTRIILGLVAAFILGLLLALLFALFPTDDKRVSA